MQQRRRLLRSVGFALTVVSGLLLGGQAVSAPAPAPAFLRFTLAGVDVRDGLVFLRYDPKADYYLTADSDMGHGSYTYAHLILSPEKGAEPATEIGRQPQPAVMPRLRSGKGVNIGDAPVAVKQKLGALPTTTLYDRPIRQLTYTYRAVVSLTHGPMAHEQMDYLATYTFHNNHLWSIDYNLSGPDDHG